MLNKSKILEAAKAFDSIRYPLDFYHHHIALLKSATAVNASVKTSVRELFLWRMGKIRSTKFKAQLSDTAKPTSFADEEGNIYFASATTAIIEAAVQNATSKDLLENGIDFRDGHLSYGEVAADARKVVRTSIFLSCFFVHLWKPEAFPFFEQKVWALWQLERGKPYTFRGTPTSMDRYLEYTTWFDALIERIRVDRWTAQLGLWELGRRLEKETKGGKT